MVDCSTEQGNHGCSGGSLRNTLKYLEGCGGLMRDKDYPYVAAVSTYLTFIYKTKKKTKRFISFSKINVNSYQN